jgi:hypothetical protein
MYSTIRCTHCGQTVDADEPACAACGHIHDETIPCRRHASRTAGGVCVLCGDAVCHECNVGRSPHHVCPDHRAVPLIEGWAQVYTTSDSIEAGLIRKNLQSEGIDAAVLDQKDTSFNLDLGELSAVRVLVPAYDYLDAMALLTAHMDYRGEVSFACPACGEPFDAGSETCESCGKRLPTARGG